jgi:N-acetylglucosaminyldiphosphoundecaprenol N-acetyl-beta-D-mannosaminyltransferase
MNFKCLNVKIDNLTRGEILGRVKSANNLQIATVNPEFILEAQKNEKFRSILNSNKTLCVADGIGLKFAAWRQGQNLKCRWAGVDLMWEILKVANEKKQKVFLIGNKDGLSTWQETAEEIKKVYPKLEVNGVNIFKNNIANNDTSYQLPVTSYNIIFSSLGAPHQEILLHQLQDKARLVMGVGGSFDFITDKIKRAPRFLRIIGLEWLWRLIQEPHYRFKKIWNAVIIFPIKIILNKSK